MRARFKALHIGLILAGELCFVQQALALGLGQLSVESNLSEPLNANIELLDVAGLDPSQISISLGTEEDFARAGVERSVLSSLIEFSVTADGSTGNIHLTTPGTIDEPFLDLVLSVSWPNGTVQREYTVLLGLPGTAGTAGEPLGVPSASPATAEAPGNNAAFTDNNGQEYAVVSGDSLWVIASRMRPGSEVSIHQMMVAIQSANQDAFINNNINRVLAGKVLRIPTLQEIRLVDQATAVARVTQQNQELGAQPLAVNRTAGNTNTRPQQDELTVLTDDQSGAGATGNTGMEATLSTLQDEMMLSEEHLDRARLENMELTGRFRMLEEEMDLLQNIIVVEDARIAQLQADLAAQAETTEQALATSQEADDLLAAQQSTAEAGVKGKVTAWLQNTAVLLGVALAFLLLILSYLFWQRRRMHAAVYAFDSGIPELETVGNSAFAPAKKAGGKGWLARLGSKNVSTHNDVDGKAADGNTLNLRDAAPLDPDAPVSIDPDETAQMPRYLDEEQMINAVNQAGAALQSQDDELAPQSFPAQPGTVTSLQGDAAVEQIRANTAEDDDAELADALIAEAKGITTSFAAPFAQTRDNAAASLAETEADAQKEAQALAALVTADVASTKSDLPESFEFSPEAVAEVSGGITDDIETFDFQLSEPDAEHEIAANDSPAEREFSDEELQFSALLLDDEEEGDFQASGPMNECDTKLDLAVAYEAMGDIKGAVEILGEVIADGDSAQIAEAIRLKGLWQNS